MSTGDVAPAFHIEEGSAYGEFLNSYDWAATEIGDPATWPQSLWSIVDLIMRSKFAMIITWGPQHAVIYNEAYARLFSRKHPRWLGRPYERMWADRWDLVGPIFERACAGEIVSSTDSSASVEVSGENQEIHLAYSFSQVRDERGEIAGLYCIVSDVSAERIAMRDLQAEQALTREIFDSHTDSFVLFDKNLRVMRANRGAVRAAYPQQASIVGRTFHDVWSGLIGTDVEWSLLDCRDNRRSHIVVYHWIHEEKDEEHWVEIRLFPVGEGVGCFYYEVTDRMRAEREIAEAKAELEKSVALQSAILSQLQEGVVVTDVIGKITFVNEAARRMTGIRLEGLTPDRYGVDEKVMTEDGVEMPQSRLPLYRAVLGATVVNEILVLRRPDGRETMLLCSAKPLLDKEGEQIGSVLAMHDETVRAEAQAKLQEMNDTLEARVIARTVELEKAQDALRQSQKMEAVGRLTGGVAHDFNNLLSVVSGSLDLMAMRLNDERSMKLLANAKGSVRRAANLTQRLLAFSRQQPLSPEKIDTNLLVGDIKVLVNKSLTMDCDLRCELAKDCWPVLADPNQLENAIINLAVNASDAMPEGGTLTIRTDNATLSAADVPADIEPGEYVAISVIDVGVGMPPQVLDRAFDPFYTTKELGKGTGLGLSIVHGFIAQSGGFVDIKSAVGEGTTVIMYLPRSFAPAERVALVVDQGFAPLLRTMTREKVLVVDDQAEVREMLEEVFRALGYRVSVASSGSEALAMLEQDAGFELLYTDIAMPGMNGIRLAEEALKRKPKLKVLYTTGFAAGQDKEFMRGNLPVVDKPFSIVDLESKIREVLDAGR